MMALGMPRKLMSWAVAKERETLSGQFCSMMKPSVNDILLEIGGPSKGTQKVISLFEKVLVANIEIRPMSMSELGYPQSAQIILSDGCKLPLKSKSVDYVFSNATLEHVPKDQWPLLAQEVVRVARKGFFVSTPNHYFPFEPHYLMPLFQFVPESTRRKLVVDYGFTIGCMSRTTYEEINLPRRKELKQLFPKAKVHGWGMPLIPFHWVCWMRNDA